MAANEPTVPQLDRGYDLRYTLFLDLYWSVGRGALPPDAVPVVFESCWAVCLQTAIPGLPLGQIRLTTVNPEQPGRWSPVRGLRPGEYVRVCFVPSVTPWGSSKGGGQSPSNIDRNPSLYNPNLCYVATGNDPSPALFWSYYGVVAAHEGIGHTMMPSWGERGAWNQHNADPSNLLYSGGLDPHPRLTPPQVDALTWQLERVRGKGVRVSGQVVDGGIPAWPITTTPPPEAGA